MTKTVTTTAACGILVSLSACGNTIGGMGS
jgi:hypothetical protein